MPYGPYGDTFDECVSKVSSWADDPKAFCAFVKHQIEGAVEGTEMTEKSLRDRYGARKRITSDVANLAGLPDKLKIISENADGSGVIEIPILRVGKVDLARTSGGGGNWDVTASTLTEIVANLKKQPGPIPIGIHPHKPFDYSGGPMPCFLEGLSVRGEELWGRFSITDPMLFQSLKRGELRGFSGEFGKDIEWPTATLEGWSMYGGVFTNRPAADVHFKSPIAASAAVSLTVGVQADTGEASMADDHVTLAVHEAKTKELNEQVRVGTEQITLLTSRNQSLKQDLDSKIKASDELQAKVITLTTERDASRAIQAQLEQASSGQRDAIQELNKKIVELTDNLKAAENVNLSAKVADSIDKAIHAGVPPAVFDGHQKDPANWMQSRFANLSAFQDHCAVLSGTPLSKTPGQKKDDEKHVRSGHDSSKGEDSSETAELTSDETKVFERLHLGTEFVGIKSKAEADKRFKEIQAAKQKSA